MAQQEILELIERDFPAVVIDERAAPHECLECDEISRTVADRTWREVPREFVADNCDVLPLLSRKAYGAYLAAWLVEGVREPDQGASAMVLINLADDPPRSEFSDTQAATIVRVAKFIAEASCWGSDNPETQTTLASIEKVWARSGESE